MRKEYALGLYEKAIPPELSWHEKLRYAKEAGYDFLEISIDETDEKIQRINMSANDRMNLITEMYKVGLPIRSMCVSALTKYSLGSNNEAYSEYGMEILEKSIQLADDLGVRVAMIPGYDVYYETSSLTTKRKFMKNLKLAVRKAEASGVILGLETMENEFMNTVEKAMKYVQLCDSNYLKVYPDIGNLTNAASKYKMDVLEDLELGKGNITSMHLKETVPGKYREIPYGEGHVDFQAAIEAAWNMGVRRFVTEFWYQGSGNWQEDLKQANKMMSEIIQRQQEEEYSDAG